MAELTRGSGDGRGASTAIGREWSVTMSDSPAATRRSSRLRWAFSSATPMVFIWSLYSHIGLGYKDHDGYVQLWL